MTSPRTPDTALSADQAGPAAGAPTAAGTTAEDIVALREGEESSQPDGAAEILMVRQYRHLVRAALGEDPPGSPSSTRRSVPDRRSPSAPRRRCPA